MYSATWECRKGNQTIVQVALLNTTCNVDEKSNNMLLYAIFSTLDFIKMLYCPLTIKIVLALTFFKSIKLIKTFTSQYLHFIIIYTFSNSSIANDAFTLISDYII